MAKNDKWNINRNFTQVEVDIPNQAKRAVQDFIDSMSEANPNLEGLDREQVTDGMVDTFREICYQYIDFLHHDCDHRKDNLN